MSNSIATVSAKKITPAQQDFNDKLAVTLSTATNADRETANEISASGTLPVLRSITASVAAVLFTEHNGINRGFSLPKAMGFVTAMDRGEWTYHHQGLAFYADGTVADGQHRLGALAIHGSTQDFLVSTDFNKEAIDAIDRSTRRSAGESLEMQGVSDGKAKATIAKFVMNYNAELHGEKPRFSDPQIEAFVIEHNALLERSLNLGYDSTQNVSDPVMTATVARQLATLMLLGQWPMTHAAGFIASVQQGVATYPDAPTIQLAKALLKSNVSDRRKDRLSGKQKIALLLKGAVLWSDELSVARLTWIATKEELPTNQAPDSAISAVAA